MGWSIGYDLTWKRDIGYGVPALCDHPRCHAKIDRGMAYVCGSDPLGGEKGCGLFFCANHLTYRTPRGSDRMQQFCPRCIQYKPPFKPKPDVQEWINHKMTDPSWEEWRRKNNSSKE